MDRSLDEIISERPVRQRLHYFLQWTIAHDITSNAVAATAVDADLTDGLLPLPGHLAETEKNTPETASER